ncbi:hypothetical protein CEXT_600071 [Caerostris extrusa]|uniref:Uncharacterized protein n=1 Tax=Caerostris extrusa TaxID=172846 RepID=A0AAV4RHD9_CAEEX|nr:hypothetical protein CEXT_600071 [Caerostris extrusa]
MNCLLSPHLRGLSEGDGRRGLCFVDEIMRPKWNHSFVTARVDANELPISHHYDNGKAVSYRSTTTDSIKPSSCETTLADTEDELSFITSSERLIWR